MSARPPAMRGFGKSLRNAVLPFLVLHLALAVLIFAALLRVGPADGDWYELKLVADHFVAGDWGRLYSVGADSINPGYYWLYPPFALYVVAPLAWLSDSAAFWTLVAIEAVAIGVAVLRLKQLMPVHSMVPEWAMAVMLSAPAVVTIAIGQSSGLILLCIVSGLAALKRGNQWWAGVLLGLLVLKPNWGVFFGIYAVARGQYRIVLSMIAVAAGLTVVTWPLGVGLWRDFLDVSVSNFDLFAGYEGYKRVTFKGFLDASLGQGLGSTSIWLLASVGLAVPTVLQWRVSHCLARNFGLVVLLAFVANPHASYYDALLLAVPGTVWWCERRNWSRLPWLSVGVLVALVWCLEQYAFTWALVVSGVTGGAPWPYPPASLVGPVALIWLVVALWQSHAMGATRTPGVESPRPQAP